MTKPSRGLTALRNERAFIDLSGWRKVRVTGDDAAGWLQDLLTTDLDGLTPGSARRSLLLTPTGRIRALLHVARDDECFWLLQPSDQPEHVGLALGPYTLSADVLLADATPERALFAVPGAAAASVGHPGFSPSVLGEGVDVLPPAGKPAWRLGGALVKAGLEEADAEALESWRIARGVPRMGSDFDQDSLPSEAGLDDAIAYDKGCYLGQESVARVRNLGHPPRMLRHLRTEGSMRAGDPVFAGADPVGAVTSATLDGTGAVALVRVRWEATTLPLALADGRTLHPALTAD